MLVFQFLDYAHNISCCLGSPLYKDCISEKGQDLHAIIGDTVTACLMTKPLMQLSGISSRSLEKPFAVGPINIDCQSVIHVETFARNIRVAENLINIVKVVKAVTFSERPIGEAKVAPPFCT